MVFVKEDITCKLLSKHAFIDDVKGMFIEISLKKAGCLMLGT